MQYAGHNEPTIANQIKTKSKRFLYPTDCSGCPSILAMSQTSANNTRQIVTHVHPANLLSLDNTLDQLIQGVQAKLRANEHNTGADVQQSQTKQSSRYSPTSKSLDSNQQRSDLPGTDLWRNKVKLREATMHQEDLLDPELVQMQTFKKARPQSGWASILLSAALRAIFLPFLYSWWRDELTKPQYFMLLTAWLLSAWNLNCYFDTQISLNNLNGTTQMVFDIELLGPALYLFLLSFTYCHIHNARTRASLSTSQQSTSGSTREKQGNYFQRDVSKRVNENTAAHSTAQTSTVSDSTSRSNPLRVTSSTSAARDHLTVFRVGDMPSRNGDAYDISRLTPIEDIGAVDSESGNQFERNSVSSQEEHQQIPESVVPSRESMEGRNVPVEILRNNDLYQSEERNEQENFEFSNSLESSNTTMGLGIVNSQRNVADFSNSSNMGSRNVEFQSDSEAASQVFVASNSSTVHVQPPMPSVASLIKQLTGRDQESSQTLPRSQNALPINSARCEGVEYFEAMVASSVPICQDMPRNSAQNQIDDQLESSFSVNLVDSVLVENSSGIRKISEHQNTSCVASHNQNSTPMQVDFGSSMVVDSIYPTSTELNSQSSPWSSNQPSATQTNDIWTSKTKIANIGLDSKSISESPPIARVKQTASSSDVFQPIYENLPRPSQISVTNDLTNQVSSSFTESVHEINPQRTNSNFSGSFKDEDCNVIPCKVSGVVKEKRSKIVRKRSRRTSTSSGTGKCSVGRVKRVTAGNSNGRASFLPKRVLCYLKEIEKAAEKASAKSSTAHLTWVEVFLRFLMHCRLWLCSLIGLLKRKFIRITGRQPQNLSCVKECHHASHSSMANRKTSSGSSRHRRSRDEQEIESDEDEDNASISDVSEEEAEETAGSSIEETEDYVHRQSCIVGTSMTPPKTTPSGSIDSSAHVAEQNNAITSTPGVAAGGATNSCCQPQMNNSGVNSASATANSHGTEKTVTIITWNQLGKCSKADLSAEQVCDLIVNRADSIRNSNFYLMFGTFCAIFISCIPFFYRYYSMPKYRVFSDIYQIVTISTLGNFSSLCLIRDSTYLTYFSFISSFLICVIFFLLLATAERTYLQRYYYSKYLYRLTSSKKAKKCEIPHFRLTKVRNIKMWLHIRFKLKAHGSQKTVEAIVSSCLLFCILSISVISFKLLEDIQASSSKGSNRANAPLSPGHHHSTPAPSSRAGSENNEQLVFVIKSNSHITGWIAISWCLALGFFLLRFITIGTKVNKKYSNTAMLTTERINLSLRMETKPEKREEYILADRVLKLACRLIAEVESPFKVSGLVMNSALYNLMRVILLSALSAAFSEMLGFNPKLWKI